MMTGRNSGISDYIVSNLAAHIAIDLLVRDAKEKQDALKVENNQLRDTLAQADQQIEQMAREIAMLRRNNAELIPEPRDLSEKAQKLVTLTKAEASKWQGRYEEAVIMLVGARNANFDFAKINAELRDRVAFLEKALNSKPGTVYYGSDGFYIRGQDEAR